MPVATSDIEWVNGEPKANAHALSLMVKAYNWAELQGIQGFPFWVTFLEELKNGPPEV